MTTRGRGPGQAGLDQAGEFGVGGDRLRLDQGQHLGQLTRRQPPVDEGRRRPGAHQRERVQEEVRAVLGHHRHDVAGSGPQARPAPGLAFGLGAKLRVGVRRAPVVDQRRQLRPHVGAPLDDVDPALHPASTFRPHRIVAENDFCGTDHARSSLRGQPGAPRHDPGARLRRPGDLRGRTRPALRPVLDVPGARVRDPRSRRLRGPPGPGRLVHRGQGRGRRGPGHVQHVPAPRHAGVPGRAGQRLALPLPVPRLDLPQRRPAGRAAVPRGGLRRRGRLRPGRPVAAARAVDGHAQRADLHQPGPGRAAAARLPRRLRVLPRLLHPAEPGRRGAARPAAVADQGQLEDRRGELRRRQLPHPAHPRQRGGHRPVPRAEGQQAQGGRPLPGRPRRGHHLQAAARRWLRGPAPLRRLPGRDDPGHGGGLVGPAAGAGRPTAGSCPRPRPCSRT